MWSSKTHHRHRSVVLLSGGLDSAANLAFCREYDEPVLALTVRYGQRAQDREVQAARKLCDFYSVEHKVLELPWVGALGGSSLTEVSQLLPDPYLQGAGYALMRRGDYFSVHADRNVAYDTGLTRRLAMIIFLNKSWRSDYHGQLELWTADAKRCEVSIEPM